VIQANQICGLDLKWAHAMLCILGLMIMDFMLKIIQKKIIVDPEFCLVRTYLKLQQAIYTESYVLCKFSDW
jgi:hypothetical protein